MKSWTALKTLFTTLSQNNSATNQSLAGILINDQHRYLLLKYFDNERIFTILTLGPKSLTLTGSLSIGAVSATLNATWDGTSCQQLVLFSSSEQRLVNFIQGSVAVTWTPALTATATTAISTMGVQSYPLPANVSKLKNSTITIGQLVYTPAPVQSIQEWTKLNALPYSAAYPAYFFVYGGGSGQGQATISFWPIPSTDNYPVTLYGQIAIADMSYEDYTTGSIAASGMVAGSNAVVGSATSWDTAFPNNTNLTFANLFITANPPKGDGMPYQVQMFNSGTTATLIKPVVNAPNISGATYLIGQYPLLDSNFHDAIVYGALRIYYQSIVKDTDRFALYDRLFGEKTEQMKYYLSNKQVNVDLSPTPTQANPNLYFWPTSANP